MFAIDQTACRGRQQRLLQEMHRLDVPLVVVTQPEHVQWLTGCRMHWLFQVQAALDDQGVMTLAASQKCPPDAAADRVAHFEAQQLSTFRNDQYAAAAEVLWQTLGERARSSRRVGVEYSSFGPYLGQYFAAEFVDVEPALYRLRRRKDADELALIRQAIAATGAMYERARQIIRPGVSEIEVFNQLQAAAVEACGEMITATGNDYQCGARGGPPRANRLAAAGELFILDLGPAFRGYFADNCRTFAVSDVSPEQQVAWEHVGQVFEMVERTVRPGYSARQLFHTAQQMLAQAPLGQFNHHLGHGMGLYPHEAPHLNPHWDEVFEVGDVFTVEPGLYADELRAGLRIEHNYRVTDAGIELLTPFPIEL